MAIISSAPLSRRRLFTVTGIFFSLSLITLALAILCGATTLKSSDLPWKLLWQLRAPRALLGYATGAALAVGGVVFQALLRNPLADPYIMGVSGGAALGGTIAIILGGNILLVPLTAFAGALLTVFIALWLAQKLGHESTLTLILTGVIINAFTSSAITMLKVLVSATKAQELLLWLMGSLGYPSWTQAIIAIAIVTAGSLALFFMAPALNCLVLGRESALALGLDVRRMQHLVFLISSLIVAIVVSMVGIIGFIGLVVPHLLRLIFGADHRLLLPGAFFSGAILLLLADTSVRLAFGLFDASLPVGVITSFLGAPFFLWLLAKTRSNAG